MAVDVNTAKSPSRHRTLLARVAAKGARARALFPLTLLGAAVIAVAASALRFYAYAERDLVAFLLATGVLGLVLVSFVVTLVAVVVVALTVPKESTRAPLLGTTHDSLETGFRVRRLAFLPLVAIDVRVDVPEVLSRALAIDEGELVESVVFGERGRHAGFERTILVSDVFGFFRVGLGRREHRDVVVLPHLGRLARLPTLRSLAHGDLTEHPLGSPDGDRLDVRRYASGDPARFIHWKVFARSGKLAVRTHERAVATSNRVVAYQVAGPDDEASAAAALAAVRYGALGDDWSFGADGSPVPTRDLDAVKLAIAGSAAHREDGGRDLEAFLREARRDGPVSVVLFAPPTPGAWLDRVAALPHKGLPMRIVLAVDAVVDPVVRSRLARIVSREQALPGVARAELEAVRSRLAGAGADVLVVERSTGRVLAQGGASSVALRGHAA